MAVIKIKKDKHTEYEFQGVPNKVADAIMTMLYECENNESKVVSCEINPYEYNRPTGNDLAEQIERATAMAKGMV